MTRRASRLTRSIRVVQVCLRHRILEKETLNAQVKPWTQSDSPGKIRANFDDSSFAIKYDHSQYVCSWQTHVLSLRCVGVFDTVGSIGIPDELKFGASDDKMRTLFG